MKKPYCLIIAVFFSLHANADWSPVINCENKKMVVDSDRSENYQLVLRDHGILQYFSQKVSLDAFFNSKNELVIPMIQTRRQDPSIGWHSIFTGSIPGGQMEVYSDNAGSVTISAVRYSYRATFRQELANWHFYSCEVR